MELRDTPVFIYTMAKTLSWLAQNLEKLALKLENSNFGLGCLNITMITGMEARSAYFPILKLNASPSLKAFKKIKYCPKFQSKFLTALFLTLSVPTPSLAQQLIQCPEWRSLIKQANPIVLAKSSPKTPFNEAVLQENLKPLSNKGPVKPAAKTRGASAKINTTPISSATCPTYKVKAGDTLAGIAQKMLGSAKRYPELLVANTETVKSVKSLKIGIVLSIPCATPKLTAKPLPKRMGGLLKKSETVVLPEPKATSKVKPLAVIAPKPIPLPVWRAKSGEYLSDVIKRWGETAGYTVIVGDGGDWRLGVPVQETGTFEDTLAKLIKGFAANGQPPAVRVFSNKVIKIGAIR
jgi:hypothetical protein